MDHCTLYGLACTGADALKILIMKIFKNTIAVVACIVVLWMAGFLAFSIVAVTASPQGDDETTDAIVVLTGGKERVEEGLKLFAKGRASHLFISGVHEDVKKAEILSLWNGDSSLPPCCVTLGYKATTTVQNAEETREWIAEEEYTSIRLVTGNYHMPRAKTELAHALPGIDIFEHPLKQPDLDYLSVRFAKLIFSEYHKWLYRKVVLLFSAQRAFEHTDT